MNDEYFALVKLIKQFYQDNNYREVLFLSLKAVNLVPAFVQNEVKELGSFKTEQILPIDYVCAYLPLLHRIADMQNIRNLFKPIPELGKWVSIINHAFLVDEWWYQIEQLINDNPGVRQIDVWKTLGIDVREVANILYRADQLGLINREKEGYKLYIIKNAQTALNQDIRKQQLTVPVE
jgi:hypothetical protein